MKTRTAEETAAFLSKQVESEIAVHRGIKFIDWPLIARWVVAGGVFYLLFELYPRFVHLLPLTGDWPIIARWLLWLPAGVALLGALRRYFRDRGLRKRAERKLQGELKAAMAAFLFPELTYVAEPTFPEEVYSSCGLFPLTYDRAFTGHRFEGTYSGLRVSMLEVHTQTESADSDGDSTYWTIWKGVLAIAEPVGPRAALTRVKGPSTMLRRLVLKLQSSYRALQSVNLGDPVFEGEFTVESIDPGRAAEVLTPERRMRLLELIRQWGWDFRASFYDDRVVLALPRSWSILGPDVDLERPGESLKTMDETVRAILETLASVAKE